MLLAISCRKESIQNSSAVSSQSKGNSVAAHYIGERYGGGIIFYIDSTGQHGLIADTADLPTATWWNGRDTVTGAAAISIGSGKSNTREIVAAQGDSGRYAARECKRSKRSGYTDWFLPSKAEAFQMYVRHSVLPGIRKHHYYWTSSESDSQQAWAQAIYYGDQFLIYKYEVNSVRAIRAF